MSRIKDEKAIRRELDEAETEMTDEELELVTGGGARARMIDTFVIGGCPITKVTVCDCISAGDSSTATTATKPKLTSK